VAGAGEAEWRPPCPDHARPKMTLCETSLSAASMFFRSFVRSSFYYVPFVLVSSETKSPNLHSVEFLLYFRVHGLMILHS
jgi:hypothetical protein